MVNVDYRVKIEMPAETVTALINSGFYLYGFKAVVSSVKSGRPLVWLRTQNYSAMSIVGWTNYYEAYTSGSPIILNGQIFEGFSLNIKLGQTLRVQAGGLGTVLNQGPGSAISILNTTDAQFTCGISQMQNDAPAPYCALPLYGKGMCVLSPVERVLLMFCTSRVSEGTVIEQAYDSTCPDVAGFGAPGAYSSGILLDLTFDTELSVTFDINNGWSWDDDSWAQEIPPNSNLVALLIESSPPQ
jgi:hypothetical protein